jgi:hypothetical protein
MFFVETIWTFGYDQLKNRSGQVLEIYGTPELRWRSIYDYLQNISELLWAEYKRRGKIKGNKHRRTFVYGLLDGFYNKLDSRFTENQSKELVWTGDSPTPGVLPPEEPQDRTLLIPLFPKLPGHL